MTTPIRMPDLGESITEGVITRWLKGEGESVVADEPLFEVSTDKVDTEVPSPVSGVLVSITAATDAVVTVGAEVAQVAEATPSPQRGEPAAPAVDSTVSDPVDPLGDPPAPEITVAIRMPDLGESITEGVITRWLKGEGESVVADEPLFEVSTDKVDTEVPSPVSGVLVSITAATDAVVAVGAEVAQVTTGAPSPAHASPQADTSRSGASRQGARPGQSVPPPERLSASAQKATSTALTAAARMVNGEQSKQKHQQERSVSASPLVRRLAREQGIDLSTVRGTGDGGRVRRDDLLAAQGAHERQATGSRTGGDRAPRGAPSQTRSPQPTTAGPLPQGVRERVVPATRLRRLIAERMVNSLATSAQLTTAVEVDMTRVMRLRAQAKDAFRAREDVALSPFPFCALALIHAVRAHPQLNSALDEDGNLHEYQDVHLGVAVDTPKGLFVPVVKHADTMNVTGLSRAIADVATRTRSGRIDPGELSGATISITNTGSRGAVWDTPIINPPNAAIFATPAIVRRPVVVDDPELGEVIAVRHMMYAVLTYDHRIVDGADAARALSTIRTVLESGDLGSELLGERH